MPPVDCFRAISLAIEPCLNTGPRGSNSLLQDGQLQPTQAKAGLKCMAKDSIGFILFGFFLSFRKATRDTFPFCTPRPQSKQPDDCKVALGTGKTVGTLPVWIVGTSIYVLYRFRNQPRSQLVQTNQPTMSDRAERNRLREERRQRRLTMAQSPFLPRPATPASPFLQTGSSGATQQPVSTYTTPVNTPPRPSRPPGTTPQSLE